MRCDVMSCVSCVSNKVEYLEKEESQGNSIKEESDFKRSFQCNLRLIIFKATCTRCRFRAVFIPNYFKKLPAYCQNLMKRSMNLVFGQKLNTSCDEKFS